MNVRDGLTGKMIDVPMPRVLTSSAAAEAWLRTNEPYVYKDPARAANTKPVEYSGEVK